MTEIRPMRPEELEAVAAFVNVCWRAAYPGILEADFLDGLTTPDRMARMRRRLDAGSQAWVAADGGAIRGIALFGASSMEEYPDDGELQMLYVDPGRIGTGLGHALLECACDELARAGYDHLILDVFAGNQRAIRFYRAHGFRTIRSASPALRVPGGLLYPLEYMRKPVRRCPPGKGNGAVTTRRARDDEADVVVGFALALADFNRSHHPERYTRDDVAPARMALEAAARRGFLARDRDVLYLIAELGGAPIGYAVTRVVPPVAEADNGTGETGLLDASCSWRRRPGGGASAAGCWRSAWAGCGGGASVVSCCTRTPGTPRPGRCTSGGASV